MTEYEIKPAGKFSLNLKELWEYKELFYFFTWRDIKVKYKQTFLGFAWAILQPAMLMLVFTFTLGRLIGKDNTSIPYPVFVYTGLIFWSIFSSGLQNAGNSMVSNANIIKKIYFPRLIIPISSILVAVFDFAMTLFLYLIMLFYYDISVSPFILIYFPAALVITILASFGAGTLLAALNIKYRDFRYVIPFLLQFLMFATPVVYPSTLIENKNLKYALQLNPMTAVMELARAGFGSPIDWNTVLVGTGTTLVLLVLGIMYFRKTEAYFADIA